MSDILSKIKEINILNLKPNDVLAVHISEDIEPGDARYLGEQLQIYFPNNKIMLLAGNLKFEVIEKES